MNIPLLRASSRPDRAATPASDSRKRSKLSPRRTFSVAARAFLTLALATCAFGAAASAQTISITPPSNTPNTPEGSGGGQTNFEFTVSLDQAPAQAVTVNFSVNNGTAIGSASGASPADFATGVGQVQVNGMASMNNTLTFPAGSVASQTIGVPVTADNLFEGDETFSVTLTNPTNGAILGTSTATATIVNDDNQPSVSIADAAPVTEGNTGTRNANFTVTLNALSGQDVTFTYNTIVVDSVNAGDGINGDADFTPQTNQVGVIQAGQLTTNIAIPIIGDTIDEAPGQFLVEISNVVGADTGNAQGVGTILDDDGPSVSVSDATASEGDGQIVFRIQLSAPSPEPITVAFTTGSNSAQVGLDYGTQGSTGTTNEIRGTRTFDPFSGDPSTGTAPFIDVPINLIDDNISEPTEIFNFTLTQVTSNNATLTGPGARRQAIGTILDNDGAPNLTVTAVNPQGTVEGNAGNTPAVFTVTLSNPTSQTVTFRYQTVAGTATDGQDFTGFQTARIGTIAAGQTSTNISVNIVGDTIDEPDETFGVRVFGASNSVSIGGVGSSEQTVFTTIIDDDGPTISIVPTNVNVTEGNNGARTPASFTVQLNTASPQDVSFTFTLGGAGNNANEATRGSDYISAATTGTITIPAGQTTTLITIVVLGDNVKENNETITLTLSAPNGGALGTAATGTITIIDDDLTPTINLTGPGSAREGSNGGQTNFVFRPTLDRPSFQNITVNFTVNDGTATAASGDFTAPTNNVVTFIAGQTTTTPIIVPVRADRLNEDDETFSVSLSNNSAGSRIGIGSVTATILNDDALPTISIRDAADLETGPPPPQGQQQGPRILQFFVSLNTPSGKDVTFTFQTTGAGGTNATLTALSGADFIPAQGQITIPAGQTTPTQPVAVTIVADTLDENDETFGVSLLSVTNATIARGGATGTIIDDDVAPNIKITAPTADNTAIEPYSTSVNNNGGFPGRSAIFPVTLSVASGRTITVRYSVSPTAANGATGDDFLDPNNPNRTLRNGGTITFVPSAGGGVTPLTQNIVLQPLGDDGDEPDPEGFNVNITAVNANFAAQGDQMAGSTIADRDPLFNNFTPDVGFESFGGVQGTVVTLTGNQFVTDNQSRIAAVRFNGVNGAATFDAPILSVNATTITARVPQNAFSSLITVVLTSGRILNTVDPGSRRLFFVQPIVTGFNPTEGVPAVTAVTITGRHFRDPRNPVTQVLFAGLPTTAQNADRGFTIVSDTQIIAFVPRGAVSGPISIRTAGGGIGPGSEQTFTVNSFNTGGIRFAPGTDTTPIFENASATIETRNGALLNPVRAFSLLLRPATQNNGNNTPLAPRRSFRVNVSLTAAIPAGSIQLVPVIQLDPRVRVPGISIVGGGPNSINFDVAAGRDPNAPIPFIVTYAGNDSAPPAAQGVLLGSADPITKVVLPATGSGVVMTLNAAIVASNDTELYPVGPVEQVLTFERRDIHTFDTDTGVALRTTEDQNSPNNRAAFRFDLANLDFPNPDPFTPNVRAVRNPINTDARPLADVVVAFTTDRPDVGRLTYYVMVNGQRVYPSGAGAQNTIRVIYSRTPTSPEYYRNPHFIQAIGQDNQTADGDQQFVVTAVSSVSGRDPEYTIPNLQLPFTFINTDNEQGGGQNDPAFNFSKRNLNTDENGQQDTFTAFLNTRPSGNVTVNFQSTRTDEVLFVDPNNPNGPGLDNINIVFLVSGTGDGRTSTLYSRPLAISVKGIDDNLRDGDQQARIVTTVVSSTDAAYASIDPPDLIDTNVDNESNGVTVFPANLNIVENSTDTFAVRLNARPTSAVTISFASTDTNTATIDSGDTLIFTPDNFSTPQTVTVRAIADNSFVQSRSVTIVSSPASSADPNFNNLVVADVSVIVRNSNTAFVVNSAMGGLRTGEDGTNDLFTVSLGQQPTANVTLILSASPASEARLSRTLGGATPSVTLTFTPTNYATPQTVNVIGQDDAFADGNKTFTISGRVTSSDPVFTQQPFPVITGTNFDNESGTGGGGNTGGNSGTTNFAANSTYFFSVPYATSTASGGTVSIRSLFGASNDFKIYRFDVANQKNSRIDGEDFQLVPNTSVLQRGIGYKIETGATAITMNTSLAAFSGTEFKFTLTRNLNFKTQTTYEQTSNGFNLIGFPFNPSQFNSVSFTTAQVQSGSDTYANVRDAAAAGVISDRLYTTDARGNLIQVSASDQLLRPYRAYFVQIYKDNVTLTFRSPSAS